MKLHGPQDILVVSLGTGQVKTPIPYMRARAWGLIGWARPLISVFMDGVSDTVEHQVGWLLPQGRQAALLPLPGRAPARDGIDGRHQPAADRGTQAVAAR